MKVCVAVVTFRRPDPLARLLACLAEQRADRAPAPDVTYLVVDNAPEGGAGAVLDAAPPAVRERATLVHVGAGNIAVARNAVLDHAPEQGFLVLVDDDEEPEPRWLDALLATRAATGADIVIGPVRPRFPDGVPAWISASGVLDLPEPDDGADLDEGISGNALLDVGAVRRLGLRFDQTLGHAGGEDQLFFRTAVWKGARMVFAAGAMVHEPVPAERLTGGYLLRREYRVGNTLGLLDRGRTGWPPGRPGRRLAAAALWSGRGAARAAVGAVRLDRGRALRGALDVARAAGMVTGLARLRYDAYKPRTGVRRSADRHDDRRRFGAGVVAVVTDEDPAAQQAGHTRYLGGVLRHLDAVGFEVVLLVVTDKLAGVVTRPRADAPWSVRSPAAISWRGRTIAKPRAVARRAAWTAFRHAPPVLQRAADRGRTRLRRAGGVDHVVGRFLDDDAQAWIAAELDALRPAAVLYNSLFLLPPDVPDRGYVICHDIVSERAAQLTAAGYAVFPPDFDRAREAELLGRARRLVSIQWDEAAVLRELVPGAEIVVVPPGYEPFGPEPRRPVAGRVLFVGSGSLHNVDGLRWFLDACWPAVREAAPGAELHVVGTVCARVAAAPAGVELRGEVDDIAAEYAAAAVVVVPLRAGSGLKVKLVEALAAGAAVVTTSVGAQGLHAWDPAPFERDDDAAGFAARVAGVLADDDRRRALEVRARAAAERFRPERAYAELDASLGVGGPSTR